jgi:hypothetical protein
MSLQHSELVTFAGNGSSSQEDIAGKANVTARPIVIATGWLGGAGAALR